MKQQVRFFKISFWRNIKHAGTNLFLQFFFSSVLLKAAAVCSCSNKRLELSRPAAPVRISFPCFFFCKKGPEQALPRPSGTWPRLDGRLQTGRRHKHTSARRCFWHWRPVTGATRGLPSCTSHTSYKPPLPPPPPHLTVSMHSYENKLQTLNVLGHLQAICTITVFFGKGEYKFFKVFCAICISSLCSWISVQPPTERFQILYVLFIPALNRAKLHDGLYNWSFLLKWTQTRRL